MNSVPTQKPREWIEADPQQDLMNKYKAKLTAKYQKLGNNFISSDENARPDRVDQVEEFVEEYDGVPYYSQKPEPVQIIHRHQIDVSFDYSKPPDKSLMIMSP